MLQRSHDREVVIEFFIAALQVVVYRDSAGFSYSAYRTLEHNIPMKLIPLFILTFLISCSNIPSFYLAISSPIEGQIIQSNKIIIIGYTAIEASVTINGQNAYVDSKGNFIDTYYVSESDIGQLQLEIKASNNKDEIINIITLYVDIKSDSINVSSPAILVAGNRYTRSDELSIQVLDRTPNDTLFIQFTNNNKIRFDTATLSGARFNGLLALGLNNFIIKATDLANNQSTLQGYIYYLPGPLTITLINPDSGFCYFQASDSINRELSVIVRINDDINNVPETIKYCKITGSSQSVLLNCANGYTYSGTVYIAPGSYNIFSIEASDIANNVATKVIIVADTLQ
jgi:hypothetical protein